MHADAITAISNGELARRITALPCGRAEAEETELYRRFAWRVRLYGRRHLRDETAAQDLAQEVLLVAIERLRAGGVRDPEQIGSFILSTARLIASGRKRTENRRAHLGRQFAAEQGESGADCPDAVDLSRLARCVDALEMQARRVIILTYYAEQSAAEIAAELGSTSGAVRLVRHRAMQRLRDCMGRRKGT